MRSRTEILLFPTYGLVASVVLGMFFLWRAQNRNTEALISR